jgi:hypothetical protein
MALVSPTLFIGLNLDDYLHRYCGLQMKGAEEICPSFLSLFTILPGDPRLTHRLVEDGFAPWWTNEHVLVSFMRPVTTLTHRLDYLLFPDSPWLMHLHSMLWLGGAVYVATRLYRSVMGVGMMSAATAFAFAVDHVHGMPVGWIANRNALVGAFFGTAALAAYVEGRKRRSDAYALIGVPCLILGLLGGEIALGVWAYFLAHALILDEARVASRVRALTPYLLATVGWRLAYKALGFGAVGSSLYIDPAQEPLVFLRALSRLPLLLLGTYGFPPSEAAFFVSDRLAVLAVLGSLAFVVYFAVAAWALVRFDRNARFWTLGSLLALIPACTAIPNNRLLYFASLGAMGLLAGLIEAFRLKKPELPGGAWGAVARLFTFMSGGLHAFISPFLLPLAALNIFVTRSITDEAVPSAIAELSDPPRQELIIVTAPEYYSGTFPRLMLRLEGRPEPKRQRLLSVGPVAIEARRLDEHRLELRYENGLLAPVLTRMYRGAKDPMAPGDRVTLEGLTIDVTEVTSDGRPLVAEFTFEKPLSSSDLRWVVWRKDRFVRFTPPATDGAVVHIDPARSSFEIGSS